MTMMKPQAQRTQRAIRGMTACNTQSQLATMATFVAVRNAPLPDVSEYDEWLTERHVNLNAGGSRKMYRMDGKKLRRIALMRREGCNFTEIGVAVGLRGVAVSSWLRQMPDYLKNPAIPFAAPPAPSPGVEPQRRGGS